MVKGIKLYPGDDHYPINDPSLETVFRIADKHQVPVMIHTGDTYAKTAKVRMAHPGKPLLYGSDCPLATMKPYLKFLHELDFTPEQFENVAWRTASRLFKIDTDASWPGASRALRRPDHAQVFFTRPAKVCASARTGGPPGAFRTCGYTINDRETVIWD